MNPTDTMKCVQSLHIEGRRWFRKTYGNTYTSCRVWIDGVPHYIGPTSGYGEYYLQMAAEYLAAHGYLRGDSKGTWQAVEALKGTYSVIDVARERDL